MSKRHRRRRSNVILSEGQFRAKDLPSAAAPGSALALRAAVTPRPPYGEVGRTGLAQSGGIILEEYNPNLRGASWFTTCDRMLRGDGSVQATELAICLPVEGLNWWVEPGGNSGTDTEIAKRLHANLMEGMTCTWEDVISECMMGPLMGVAILEKVWEERDGMTWLRKLAPRHPRTVRNWMLDDAGGIQGVVQSITGGDSPRTQSIPIEKLIVATWRSRMNPEGRGIMRAMYKHWYIKDNFYRISNVGMERFWIPTPWGRLPAGANDQDATIYRQALEAIRAAVGGGIILPNGYEDPKLLESALRVPDILALINHHDLLIPRSGLAHFLNLGSSDVGSWALSDSQIRFFLLSLGKVIRWIKGLFGRYLIPQWVGFNYPGYKVYPGLACSPISHILQPGAIAEALQKLATGQLITPDDDIEDTLREIYELPPRSEVDDEEPPAEDDDADGTDPTAEDEDAAQAASRRWGRKRGSLHASRTRPRQRPRDDARFKRAQTRLSAAKDDFQKQMKIVVERQHKALLQKLEPIITDFRDADDLQKGSHLKRMQAVEVPLVMSYQNLVGGWLRDFYTTALATAADTAGVEKPTIISNAMRTWMATKAQVIAQQHGESLRAAVLHEILEAVRRDLPVKKIIWNATQISRKRSTLDLRTALQEAGTALLSNIEDMFTEEVSS